MTRALLPGIHLVHKPVGPTSRDVLEAHRGGSRLAMCHGGALDPFAEGLLLVLVGEATKLFDALHRVPKAYDAEIAWGRETANGDPLGTPVAEGDARLATPERLAQALAAHVGWTEQIPPATSNKRVGGERAWARAHRGEVVELPPSRVYLHSATWLAHGPGWSRLRLVCGGGFYVRSLVRDVGRSVGSFGHLRALRRTAIGPWRDPGRGSVHVQGAGLLPWMRWARVESVEPGGVVEAEVKAPAWALPAGFPEVSTVRLLRGERLVGLAEPGEGGLRVSRVLRGGL